MAEILLKVALNTIALTLALSDMKHIQSHSRNGRRCLQCNELGNEFHFAIYCKLNMNLNQNTIE
jgi:hypothetical protein